MIRCRVGSCRITTGDGSMARVPLFCRIKAFLPRCLYSAEVPFLQSAFCGILLSFLMSTEDKLAVQVLMALGQYRQSGPNKKKQRRTPMKTKVWKVETVDQLKKIVKLKKVIKPEQLRPPVKKFRKSRTSHAFRSSEDVLFALLPRPLGFLVLSYLDGHQSFALHPVPRIVSFDDCFIVREHPIWAATGFVQLRAIFPSGWPARVIHPCWTLLHPIDRLQIRERIWIFYPENRVGLVLHFRPTGTKQGTIDSYQMSVWYECSAPKIIFQFISFTEVVGVLSQLLFSGTICPYLG